MDQKERALVALQKNRRWVREIIDRGVDPSKPIHLIIARGCALYVAQVLLEAQQGDLPRNT